MQVTIYHNPKCSKSRQTLTLLHEKNVKPHIIEYLKTPPTIAELESIVSKLQIPARKLVRTKEYENLKLPSCDTDLSLFKLMVAHPQVIERPIVVVGEKACIGRPPENIFKIL